MDIKYHEALNHSRDLNDSMHQLYVISSVIMEHDSTIGNIDLVTLKTNACYNAIRLCSVKETFKCLEKLHHKLITMHRDLHVRKELIKDMINDCDMISNETIKKYDRIIDEL